MIELDKRILDGKKPLTCFDVEQAQNFVGKKCYLTNDISLFANLDKFIEKEGCSNVTYAGVIDTFQKISTEVGMIFETTYLRWKFCIPCEWVKQPENKYRPFTNEEFFNLFDTGKLFSIRKKNERGRFIITDVYFNDDCEKDAVFVKLNHCDAGFAMRYLLRNDFEYFDLDGKEWKPFGVKE